VRRAEYGPGETVCYQGEQGHQYFVVEKGALRITRVDPVGRVLEVQRLGPGAAFGETSLLLGDVRDATVEATERTILLYIEKEDFDRLLEEQPQIERALRMRPDVAERRRYPRFSWLEEGEFPVKVVRKHPAILYTHLLIPAILGLILLMAALVARTALGGWVLLIAGVLLLLPLGACLYFYIDWRNDVYVVTNRRVIHRERMGLLREHFAAAPLHAIENVQQIQIGPVSRLWGYGDLIIETAGELGQISFRSIPDPGGVRTAIFGEIERTRARARAEERAAIRRAMRRHFLEEEEEEVGEEPTVGGPGLVEQPGCLLAPTQMLRYFLPPTWHREGSTITWRKHWIALARPVVVPLLIFLLITVLVLFVTSAEQIASGVPLLLYAVSVLILVPWLLWRFEDWQNDFYQVTSTRLIHVERLPFFLREERREASLDQITNVRFEQPSLGKIFHYGDVIVETAARAGTFHLRSVTYPQRVQAEIFAHIETFRRLRQEQEAERHQAELLDWFSVYDEIRRTQLSSEQETG